MKSGRKHHFEMKKPSQPWGGYLHIHVTEHFDKSGPKATSYFGIGAGTSKANSGYEVMAIPEDQLLGLAFFLFDVAEKNGLVPSADKAELRGDPVAAAPAVAVENPKKRKKSKKKTVFQPGDEVVSSAGDTYTFQGYDADGWITLSSNGRNRVLPPSYVIHPA